MLEIGEMFNDYYKVVDRHISTGTTLDIFTYRTIVYIIEDISSHDKLVAKTMIPTGALAGSKMPFIPFEIEVNLTHELSEHPNFVKPLGLHDNKNTDSEFLILEFIDGKQIGDIATNSRDYFYEDFIDYTYQILSALSFIKQKGYTWTDVSEENILVDKNNVVKLIDFSHMLPLETTEKMIKSGIYKDEYLIKRGYFKIGILLLKMYNVSLVNELYTKTPINSQERKLIDEWLEGWLSMANSMSDFSSTIGANMYLYSPEEREIRKLLKKDVKGIIRPLLWIVQEHEHFDIDDLFKKAKEIHDKLGYHNCPLAKLYELPTN